MRWKTWEELPNSMQCKEIEPYYKDLEKKRKQLVGKRIFDVWAAMLLLILLFPVMVGIAIWICLDSKGSFLFQQKRITQYGRIFTIYKFRTMVTEAERFGTQVTTKEDKRITKVGTILRKYRLDELPQLFNIIKGDMSFVGTRPEVPKYVKKYSNVMKATLLLPAGVTSMASIHFKDEERLLSGENEVDYFYVRNILPKKMKWNLTYLRQFSLWKDIKIMLETVMAVL